MTKERVRGLFDLQPIFTLYPTHSQSKCQYIILISYSTVTDLTDKSAIHNLHLKRPKSKNHARIVCYKSMEPWLGCKNEQKKSRKIRKNAYSGNMRIDLAFCVETP